MVLEKLILPWKFSSLCLIFFKVQVELVFESLTFGSKADI